MDDNIDNAIVAISYQYKLPVHLVRAMCEVESAFNPWSFRYEPHFQWIVGDKLTMTQTEMFGQKCSWGILQIMGAVAREYGYTGTFPQLCEPDIGLNYGCRHLQKFYTKYTNWPDAIASYNAGSPRHVGGLFINQGYVTKVLAAWNRYDTKAQI